MALADNQKGFHPADPRAPLHEYPEAASQSFKRGDLLILSSKKLAIGLAGSTELCGVAARDASGTTDTLIPAYDDPDTVFVGRQDDATAIGAGDKLDLVGGAGAMQINGDLGTNSQLKILREVSADEAAGAGKQWLCKINKHAFADESA